MKLTRSTPSSTSQTPNSEPSGQSRSIEIVGDFENIEMIIAIALILLVKAIILVCRNGRNQEENEH
jgi:hypothetical protein